MIRRPTPRAELYAWHESVMRGERPPVHEGEPCCGWYRRRLVKDGPFVPAEIRMLQVVDHETGELAEPELLMCWVNGEPRDPFDQWTWLAREPIAEAEFRRMTAAVEWAGSNDPTSPLLMPTAPVVRGLRPTLPRRMRA